MRRQRRDARVVSTMADFTRRRAVSIHALPAIAEAVGFEDRGWMAALRSVQGLPKGWALGARCADRRASCTGPARWATRRDPFLAIISAADLLWFCGHTNIRTRQEDTVARNLLIGAGQLRGAT